MTSYFNYNYYTIIRCLLICMSTHVKMKLQLSGIVRHNFRLQFVRMRIYMYMCEQIRN